MRPSARVAALVFVTLASACSTLDDKLGDQDWYRTARTASGKAADSAGKAADSASETAAKVAARMKQYLAEKDLLQTFRDASDHSEGAVLDVLHKVGISNLLPGGKPSGPPSATPPGPGTPPPAKPPQTQLPAAIPEQYAGAYRWPLDAGIVSSEYGARWGKVHKGIDIAAATGEPVYAVADGEVIYASDGLRGYGNVVILRHDRKLSSLYAHNSALKVKVGDQVKQGNLISLLGSTGQSTGPHVHFEIREGDNAVDPRSLLPKGKFAVAGSSGPRPATGATAK